MFQCHPFHMVTSSPWPLLSSLASFSILVNSFSWVKGGNSAYLVMSLFSLLMVISQWFRDVLRESIFLGNHTSDVISGLTIGFIGFLASEVMFFFSFFFSYFFTSLSPEIWLGEKWPPEGMQTLDWSLVPLGNTMILLSSGISVTFAHFYLLNSSKNLSSLGVFMTIVLAVMFTFFQVSEYYSMTFTICDSVYGSLFYLMTGFHGIHVLIGSIYICYTFIQLLLSNFTSSRMLGFEFSSWYWHFVDVVWLFLFVLVYWWPSL